MIVEFKLKDKIFSSPIFLASGTVAFGERVVPNLKNKVGAIITIAITAEPRAGNPPPRIMETPCGLINSIGLKNPGVKAFAEKTYPGMKEWNVPVIVNVAGSTVNEYVDVLKVLEKETDVAAYEINISCPNVIYETDSRSDGITLNIAP
jgi:dihydroorotate dehydrogenase (NAD+) catalytic subunit